MQRALASLIVPSWSEIALFFESASVAWFSRIRGTEFMDAGVLVRSELR